MARHPLHLLLALGAGTLGRPADCAKASAAVVSPDGAVALDEQGSATQGAIRREADGGASRGGADSRDGQRASGQVAVRIEAGGEVSRDGTDGQHGSMPGAVRRDAGGEASRGGAAASSGQQEPGKAAVRVEAGAEVSRGGAAARDGQQGPAQGAIRRDAGGEASRGGAAARDDQQQGGSWQGAVRREAGGGGAVPPTAALAQAQAELQNVSGHLDAALAQDIIGPASNAGDGPRGGDLDDSRHSRPAISRNAGMLPAMAMVTNSPREAEGQTFWQKGIGWSPLHCVALGFVLLVFSNAGAWLWSVWPWRLAPAREERF